ncbi:hypothetical protein CGRA01v4_01750 [Colletotrichum graminicola]|uniref:Uncharacterized protein n=1 Tax=Colletotrichum graminicola (strain M1.001 / M2 / FGSC 10212) TaxID=645133 RepID=E3QW97_COLGM|nr:uncharacterized protein GLRG_10275 [Colletotrichum graminicola M1.001]EFQ35131.1 hypothetical protein GLRG_10275 [Colletotrichum graminicola M1.001]WDK10471.1 hypothetical protein CGRA01v4_01750 [Colletotrichum graminicola]
MSRNSAPLLQQMPLTYSKDHASEQTGPVQTKTGGTEQQAHRPRERVPISAHQNRRCNPASFSTFLLLAPLSLQGSLGHDVRDGSGLVSIGKADASMTWTRP